MNTLRIEIKDRLAIVALDRGRSNPINTEMVADLGAFFTQANDNDEIGGVLLTGKENFFSAGLDLIELYGYNEQQCKEFFEAFLKLPAKLLSFKKPLVAAISGHSPAGGCVLALCCDYRFMASGKFIIGLNELQVGIIVPDSIFNLYAFLIDQRKAYQYLLEGKLLNANEALADGLVDEVLDPGDLLAAAEKRARTYMNFNPETWSQSKLNLRKELIAQFSADHTVALNIMLKQWWSPVTRRTIEAIIQSLKPSAAKA